MLDTSSTMHREAAAEWCGWNNSSGLRRGPEKTLLIFYTDYKTGSSIAYSHDRGRSWTRYANNPVIPGAVDMRDPNAFWYAQENDWRMVRYEKKGFAFYRQRTLSTGSGSAE